MAMDSELAGRLRERVMVEQWVETRDEAALADGAWVQAGACFAAIAPERPPAGELLAGDALQTAARWRVTLRAPTEVGLMSRLWWRGERLTVLAVERDPGLPDRVVLRCRSAA